MKQSIVNQAQWRLPVKRELSQTGTLPPVFLVGTGGRYHSKERESVNNILTHTDLRYEEGGRVHLRAKGRGGRTHYTHTTTY